MQAPIPWERINSVCKHKPPNCEYKLPTLQMSWETLYVTFLWITPHKPTWWSLQSAESCPQCFHILYFSVPMFPWRIGGWLYPSGEQTWKVLRDLPSQSGHVQHEGKLSFSSLDEVLRYSQGLKRSSHTSQAWLDFISLSAADVHLQRAAEPYYQIRQAGRAGSLKSS